MQKIILVQPKVGSWEFVRSKPMLPLAFLYISAPLLKDYDVRIIDQRINENWQSELENEIKQGPICVGLTSLTGSQLSFMQNIANPRCIHF